MSAPAADILRACREAGVLELAEDLVAHRATIEQARAQIAAAVEVRRLNDERAKHIRGLCAKARLPELAEDYIEGGMALAQVRRQLTNFTARLDAVEIDASLDPDGGAFAGSRASWRSAFARVRGVAGTGSAG